MSASGFRVSLVVPLKNEEASLPALVTSIRGQSRLPDEVVLVDGGSTDATVALADRLIGSDATFRVVQAGDATPGRGRNVGTAAAKFDWVAYTDGGIRLDPKWLAELVSTARRHPEASVIYGAYEPVVDSFLDRCATLAYVAPKQMRDGHLMRGPFIASTLVRQEAWRVVGGFPDLRAAEDLIFMERLEDAGFAAAWAPKALVWWQLPQSLRRTFNRFVLYSRHNVLAGRQHLWHYGVARQYAAALPFVALGVWHSLWWLAVPAVGALLRVMKSIWQRRGDSGWRWCLNPARVAGVAVIILIVDVATFVGWSQAVRLGGAVPRRTPPRETRA